jgi:hypothetical protein
MLFWDLNTLTARSAVRACSPNSFRRSCSQAVAVRLFGRLDDRTGFIHPIGARKDAGYSWPGGLGHHHSRNLRFQPPKLGFKYQHGVFNFNGAVFYNRIENLQVSADAGSCSSRVVFNVPKAHTIGLEAQWHGYQRQERSEKQAGPNHQHH